jgi:hypothetical protein
LLSWQQVTNRHAQSISGAYSSPGTPTGELIDNRAA